PPALPVAELAVNVLLTRVTAPPLLKMAPPWPAPPSPPFGLEKPSLCPCPPVPPCTVSFVNKHACAPKAPPLTSTAPPWPAPPTPPVPPLPVPLPPLLPTTRPPEIVRFCRFSVAPLVMANSRSAPPPSIVTPALGPTSVMLALPLTTNAVGPNWL